jgi:hypothetical protein
VIGMRYAVRDVSAVDTRRKVRLPRAHARVIRIPYQIPEEKKEGAPNARPSDSSDVRTQEQRRRVAPDGRARRAASAPVDDRHD